MTQNPESSPANITSTENSEDKISFKHDKDGLSIHITIYNTNNNANQRSEAGQIQKAETGGQISGKKGQNANQGGQIAEESGQNANQDSEVESKSCGSCIDESHENTDCSHEKKHPHHKKQHEEDPKDNNNKWIKKPSWPKPKKKDEEIKHEAAPLPAVE